METYLIQKLKVILEKIMTEASPWKMMSFLSVRLGGI